MSKTEDRHRCQCWQVDGYVLMSDAPDDVAVPKDTDRWLASPNAVNVREHV